MTRAVYIVEDAHICDQIRETVLAEAKRKTIENADTPPALKFGWAYHLYSSAIDAYARGEDDVADRIEDQADRCMIEGDRMVRHAEARANTSENLRVAEWMRQSRPKRPGKSITETSLRRRFESCPGDHK